MRWLCGRSDQFAFCIFVFFFCIFVFFLYFLFSVVYFIFRIRGVKRDRGSEVAVREADQFAFLHFCVFLLYFCVSLFVFLILRCIFLISYLGSEER